MTQAIAIDASLTLSFVLKEDNQIEKVSRILEDQLQNRIRVIAPTIWLYETLNGLRSALIRSRIDSRLANKYMANVLELKPQLFDFELLAIDAFRIASGFDISIYDASYIALAKEQGCTFYTGDLRLFNKVGNKLKFIKYVMDYKASK